MSDAIGPQKPQPDPRGWLVFDYLPPDLQAAEDATAHADYMRAMATGNGIYTRPATPAERELLEHLGLEDLSDDLMTMVIHQTPGVRLRRWPQLEPGGAGPRSVSVRSIHYPDERNAK